MKLSRKRLPLLAALAAFAWMCGDVFGQAQTNYVTGHIKNLTTISAGVLISVDAGPPTNCSSTPLGWMIVETSGMQALLLGLYMQGNLSSLTMTIYTSGIDSTGYCAVGQVAPPAP